MKKKKLATIELNDFRAFRGSTTFDFTLQKGNAADLIAIYAPNGMGKTSFFDAVEWGLTGKIDRLQNDIKSNKYEGYILKNRNSSAETSSVCLTFDDSTFIQRKTQRLNKKDYSKGLLVDAAKICTYLDWYSLILPHNRIDGLISATKPVDKYNYWGAYWDASGSERKLFDFLYKMKKQAKLSADATRKECDQLKKELGEITISDQKANLLNKYIDVYNRISKEKLPKFKNDLLYQFVYEFASRLSSIRKNLTSEYDDCQSAINQLNFLKSDYARYSLLLDEEKFAQNVRNRWLSIIRICEEKYQKTNQLYSISSEIEENQKELDKLTKIDKAGLAWFGSYLEYVRISQLLGNSTEKRDELIKSLNSWTEQKNHVERKGQETANKIDEVTNIKEDLYQNVEMLNKQSLHLKCSNEKLTKLNMLEQKNATYQVKIKLKQDEITDLHLTESNIKAVLDKFSNTAIRDIGEFSEVFKHLKQSISNIEILEEDTTHIRRLYTESEKLSKELENILRNSRDYISNTKLKVCPLCKREYSSMEELISRTMLNLESNLDTQKYYSKWLEHKDKLDKENEKIVLLMNEWNQEIDRLGSNSTIELELCNKKMNKIGEMFKKVKKRIEQTDIEALTSIFKKHGLSDKSTKEDIDKWCKLQTETLNKASENLKIQLQQYDEYILQINNNIIELENNAVILRMSKNDFEICLENNDLIAVVKSLNLSDWEEMKKKKLILEDKLGLMLKKVRDIKQEIIKYPSIDIKKESYYREKYEKSNSVREAKSKKVEDYVKRYLGYFGDENITQRRITKKYKQIDKKLDKIKVKLSSLNSLTNEVAFSDYVNKVEALRNKIRIVEQQLAKYDSASLRFEVLFDVAKIKLERKLTGIFNEALTNDIYRKIEPHPLMKKLKYEVSFNEEDRPELNIYVVNDEGDEKYLPEWYFSSAQLNAVALSTFLGRAISNSASPLKTIFIDDPVGHFDDINIIAFVDLLRAIVESQICQIIISTHDEVIYNLIRRKIPEEYYKSKFIEFKAVGVLK